ncbi:MAG: hypothetical protein DWQ44_11570 [Bacteroidetes bacterium]|nr:MAG: hypothetical protein DWQ33_09690 [Bacteroidota bacterium]REK05259.1 MAG: hypothetical protein DWQ39_08700 [Bacteroidota bacterium]REK32664.1 MAG: hypothetical protein DWQ44_11570 [Bacteroidota bacterium]
MRLRLLFFLLLIAVINACKKDDEQSVAPGIVNTSLNIEISYEVDGQSLRFDTSGYTCDAGYNYSVSRLWYYLGNVCMIRQDSSLELLKNFHFADAADASTSQIAISNAKEESYIGLQFLIGLDSLHNQPGYLPATSQNLNMEWPVMMGGGYHFLKFEGHFSDSSGLHGFAMHLGTNNALGKCVIYHPILIQSGTNKLRLAMNLNEWFRNPFLYDFNIDGNYSMGNMAAMMKLSQNGNDVFIVK